MDNQQVLEITPTESQKMINVAAEMERSVVNGPGVRYVVWVQGCPFRCAGCYNQDFLPFQTNQLVAVEELAERILSVRDIEGVTFSGGEPMMQAEGLYYLSNILKANGLTTFCYSGFTLEELKRRKNPYVASLLSVLDVLVDGRYDETQKANLMWRGSTNQRVHFLSERYRSHDATKDEGHTEMEMVIGDDDIVSTGILQEEVIRRLEKLLASKSNE